LHEVIFPTHIGANPSPQNGQRKPWDIFQNQHHSFQPKLEVMVYKCFDNLHLFGTWTTRILQHLCQPLLSSSLLNICPLCIHCVVHFFPFDVHKPL
jgi:hypothetical protein